jgi:DNA repair exonuclease SbcCD ATPase subunit
MGCMTDGDPLRDAVAELYSSDPGEFVQRRGALVAQARAAGQDRVAKQIAGLRKPTRSAWIVNQLVRAVPGVTSELASLGQELRAAQSSLDGEALRELSRRRRELVESLTRQAFTVSGQQAPPAGLRDEVTATFGAALADPQVAAQLGTLERAVHSEGFGSPGPAGPPSLTLVRGTGGQAPARPARRVAPARPAAPSADRERAERERAERERAERERRRRAALAEAEQAAAEADRAADAAAEAEQELQATVQRLEIDLADARRDLADARSRARRARARQHSARQALDRLRS